jgi:hypothetical protein
VSTDVARAIQDGRRDGREAEEACCDGRGLTDRLRPQARLRGAVVSYPSPTLALTLLAGVIAILAFASPAAAATPCGAKVAEDWRDNSRIDGIYPLHCYEEGIEAIPAEIRDYSNAEEVIRNAYLSAGGRDSIGGPPGKTPSSPNPPLAAPNVDTSASSQVPLPVIVLGAMSILLVASGAFGYLSRRRNAADDET